MRPTIKKVSANGYWVWEVEYCGMTKRFHEAHDWTAHAFYEQVLHAYAAEDSSKESS